MGEESSRFAASTRRDEGAHASAKRNDYVFTRPYFEGTRFFRTVKTVPGFFFARTFSREGKKKKKERKKGKRFTFRKIKIKPFMKDRIFETFYSNGTNGWITKK